MGQKSEFYDYFIVGAGFGGMGAAIALQRLGIEDFVIVDREDDLGGTWHVNRYPGLAVDVASFSYSYSFAPNPRWSRVFAPGDELKNYAVSVAEKYDLLGRMRFNVNVKRAAWDETEETWTVETSRGTYRARYLVVATGFLSQPHRPDIPGINDFKGKIIHTADWDHDWHPEGRRAAVIGTGATAVQLIPEIAPQLAHLDVYQRTPIWVVPKFDGDIPEELREIFARIPALQRLGRAANFAFLETLAFTGVLRYRQWAPVVKLIEEWSKSHLRSQVKDPDLREKLTPKYGFGCKRPTFSNNYFSSFNRPNVSLVTDGIERIEKDAVVDRLGKRRPIDTLVLATGFDLWETNFPAFPTVGRDGLELGAYWRSERFCSYEGVSVPKFPNFLCLTAPFAFTGLNFFWTIEAQMKHMERLIKGMRKKGATKFEVRPEAMDRFSTAMRKSLDDSVFLRGNCAGSNTYYLNPHGEPTLLRPTTAFHGNWRAGRFPLKDYRFS